MALEETTFHTSPSHHYVRLRFFFSTRLSSFPFVSSLLYAFPVFPFILLLFSLSLVLDLLRALSIVRFVCYRRIYLCFGFILRVTLFSQCFIWRIFYLFGSALAWIDECEESSPCQLIRAELPSKLSSEPLSESLSKLSSHQIPHSLSSEGTTTAKGLYAKFFFVLIHYAFGGVSALCVLHALSTPLRPRGRTGVFRRREGRPRLPISGLSFFLL